MSALTAPAPDAATRAALRAMKRRATGLLAAVTAAFAALHVAGPEGAWVGYAVAAAEGSMVGGLADWFAVTALFRHPLGLPIPHTAVIRVRKDQFGATLGGFVQDEFLAPGIVSERVRAARVGDRLADWLARPESADAVAGALLEAAAGAVGVVSDAEVQRLVQTELDALVERADLAPLAGRVLEAATREGRHASLFDAGLRGVINLLDEQREPLRARFGDESPWWLPGAIEDRLFDRIVDGARLLLASVVADPDHDMRKAVDGRLAELAARLQSDPAMAERARELARDVLGSDALRGWVAGLWDDVKAELAAPAPESALRSRLAGAVAGAGRRLQAEEAMRERLSEGAGRVAERALGLYGDEVGDLIASTVARWDAAETADKLELLLGRDLQFIRINGTVVGGLAGLGLHAAATGLG